MKAISFSEMQGQTAIYFDMKRQTNPYTAPFILHQ